MRIFNYTQKLPFGEEMVDVKKGFNLDEVLDYGCFFHEVDNGKGEKVEIVNLTVRLKEVIVETVPEERPVGNRGKTETVNVKKETFVNHFIDTKEDAERFLALVGATSIPVLENIG